jgi:hypothetical protein
VYFTCTLRVLYVYFTCILRVLYVYFTCNPIHIHDNISLNPSQNEKCFRQKICRENENISYSVTFFWKIVPFVRKCEENILGPNRSQMAIWRMRIAYCIPKVTDHTRNIAYIFLFHGTDGYANAPQHTYISCLDLWYDLRNVDSLFGDVCKMFLLEACKTASKQFGSNCEDVQMLNIALSFKEQETVIVLTT